MILLLGDSIFAPPTDGAMHITLMGLLQRAVDGKCYISVRSPQFAGYRAWLDARSAGERYAWLEQLDWATRDAAAHRIVRVQVEAGIQSNWLAAPPRLNIADALDLIDTPFRIVVENARNDRHFVVAALPATIRPFFEWLEARSRLSFLHGGGNTELRKIVEEQICNRQDRRLTHWVLLDSDGGAPGEVSQRSQQAADACTMCDVPHHVLTRRAIENYVPKAILYDWAQEGGRDTARRLKLIDAFFRMSPEQRHHYHFKSGFSGPASQREVSNFATLPDEDRRLLHQGISKQDIGGLFGRARHDRLRDHMVREGSTQELLPKLAQMMEILRAPYVR